MGSKMNNFKDVKARALLKASELGVEFKGVRIDEDGEVLCFESINDLKSICGLWVAECAAYSVGYFTGGNSELAELNLELIKLDIK